MHERGRLRELRQATDRLGRREARERLVDTRASDAYAWLALLDGRELADVVREAAALLATVTGQDLEEGDDGILRIARRVATDRVISVVDPEARHGHKSTAHGFDGYKGHVAIDPDTEIITATVVTPGNEADASVAEELIADLLEAAEATGAGEGEDEAPGQEEERAWSMETRPTGPASSSLPRRRQNRLEAQDPATCCKERAVRKGPVLVALETTR